MNSIQIFLWGLCGSLAIEIVTAVQCFQARRHRLPFRYRLWQFYAVRGLLALVAGTLAVAYEIDRPLLALNIGAATPLLMQMLAKTHPLDR